jgi:hypothetical protein
MSCTLCDHATSATILGIVGVSYRLVGFPAWVPPATSTLRLETTAAGAAPIYPGDPGWQPKFNRNNDGLGSE